MISLHVVCQTNLRHEKWWLVIMAWSFFFMSFFFFKAGYFNKGVSKLKTWDYCKDRFKRLLVPYLAWGTVGFLVYMFFLCLWPDDFTSTWKCFHAFRFWIGGWTIGNAPLWFLLSFCVSYILMFFIQKVRYLHWIILAFPFIGYWLYCHGNPIWLMLNNVFCGTYFFYLGKVWHIALGKIGKNMGLCLSAILVIAFIVMNIVCPAQYEMHINKWFGPWWAVVANVTLALTGISGILLELNIPRIPAVCHIGEHSMVYFVAHYPMIVCYVFSCHLIGHSIEKSIPDAMAMTIIAFALCTILVPWVEKVPWLSGRPVKPQS